MPLYHYRCDKCGEEFDEFKSLDQYQDPTQHSGCGGLGNRVIKVPLINPVLGGGDWQGYHDMAEDKWVTSRKERREIMARNNCVDMSDVSATKDQYKDAA